MCMQAHMHDWTPSLSYMHSLEVPGVLYSMAINVGQQKRMHARGRGDDQDVWDTCTEVMEPLRVVVMRSCSMPRSVASVGW